MADSSYQRSINQAAATLAAANADWDRINSLMEAIPQDAKTAGGPRESEFASLSKQLDAAAKRSATSEAAYQDAIGAADKAAASEKTFAPVGETRQRLDTTAGNVLVAVTEIADGRGGWSNDPKTPPAKVDIPGVTPKAGTSTVTAAPTGRFVLKDGVITKNDAYEEPTATPGGAVPTSEYVYGSDGKPTKNVAYVPPKADKPADLIVNTTAKRIPDPNHPGQFMDNPNYVEPTAGAVAQDAATASTAQGVAEANLATAQLALADAQRRARQSPTDEQAQAAIATAQKGLDLANKGLEAAQAQTALKAPGEIAQQGATLEQTQAATEASRAATEKGKQGDLYGLQDKIKQIRDLIASGEVKPADGDAMVAAAQRGTDIYSVLKQQQTDKDTARSQDISNKGNLASNFTSTFNNSLSQFQQMNQTGAIGSDATGKAFLATLGLAQDYLKSYEQPAATPTDYLGPMVAQAQQQLGAGGAAGVPALPGGLPALPGQAGLPPLPAAAPPPPVASAPPVTINIGSAPQPSGLLPPGVAGTATGDPRYAGAVPPVPPPSYMTGAGPGPVNSGPVGQGDRLAAAASQATMATKGEVIKTLFPRHAAQLGL